MAAPWSSDSADQDEQEGEGHTLEMHIWAWSIWGFMFLVKGRFCRHFEDSRDKYYGMELERLPFSSVRPSCSHSASVSVSEHQALACSIWSAPSRYLIPGYFIALRIICITVFISLHESLTSAPRRILAQSRHFVSENSNEFWKFRMNDALKISNEWRNTQKNEQVNKRTHVFRVNHERSSAVCNHPLRQSLLKQQCNIIFCLPKLKYVL